ncbi:putative type IX sorting system protein PorV2 [Pedobacter arcticus]|uniref:putative type IX sorting system protein PorV2 n=1 Tax=Pedobacter arcticus TaxID=752140 RepID=UPI0002D34E38|nr:PorV/PorQ family protein [Pedobacter arcticus]
MIKRLFFYFLLSLPLFVNAQTRKYSNEFLQIGVGSRAFGMAGSVVASSSDVTAGYWNPAALMNMKSQSQASLMHSEYFSGIAKYDYAGFSTFVADNTAVVGASLIRFGVDDIPDTSELIDADGNINYNRVKSFSAADYAFLFSYARRQKKAGENGLSYGANVKIIHRKVGEYGKSWGFGIDVAAQYKFKKFTFAAVGRDITTTFNAWSYNPDKFSSIYTATGNDIPKNSTETTLPRIILGTAYETQITEKIGILAEADLNFTTDGKRNVLIAAKPVSIDPTIGLEANYKKTIFLRTGVGNIQKTTDFDRAQQYQFQPNLGLGVKIKNFSIDYALTNIGNQSDGLYSNVFSVRLDFDKKN